MEVAIIKKKIKLILVSIICIFALLILSLKVIVFFANKDLEDKYNEAYSNWQKIYIDNAGTFYVPQDWIFSKNDKMLYFTDKPMLENTEYKIYLIGYIWDKDNIDNNNDIEKLFEIIDKEPIYAKSLSNSAGYAKMRAKIENEIQEVWLLDFDTASLSNNKIFLYSLYDFVDEDTIAKIANSFVTDVTD